MKIIQKIFLMGLAFFFLGNSSFSADQKQEKKDATQPQDPFVYDDHGKKDPFWPLVGPGGNIINYGKDFVISDLKLQGILVEADNSNLAIVNGIIVKVKDKVGQYTVDAIYPKKVILMDGEKKYELKLRSESSDENEESKD